MADDSQEKTEEPTGKREEEFRDEGRIAKSMEVSALASIVTALAVLMAHGESMGTNLSEGMKSAFHFSSQFGMDVPLAWLSHFAAPVIKQLVAFMIMLLVVSVIVSLAQTGIVLTFKPLAPNFGVINPFAGLKKMFSVSTFVNFAKSFSKVIVIGYLAYDEIHSRLTEIITLTDLPLTQAISWTLGLVGALTLKICIFMAVVAAGDYMYQWFSIREKMRMSHQEIKDEMKESEIPSHVKNRVRQIAQERSKRTIQKEVPTADVIVVNPTHYAVAIRYERFKDHAPRVVAKGKDLLATVIRKVANESQVPIYEYPELARSLYKQVKVGGTVPFELYESVARVLAFIYRVHKQRKLVKI